MQSRISIIIPVLNESACITETLLALQPLRAAGHEVILVDGGSTDETVATGKPHVDKIFLSPGGRARQMNAGAQESTGDVLLFLHADTTLPPDAAGLILRGLDDASHCWGRFNIKLSGKHLLLRCVEFMMNLRSRLTGIATGDQAIFVLRSTFENAGRFPEQPLMEDIALCRKLKKYGPPLCISRPVTSSSRRWEKHGVLRTILMMWLLRLAYFCGADTQRLARVYYR